MTRNGITHEHVLVALLMLFAALPICAARAGTGNRNSKSPPNVAQLIQQLKSPERQRRRDAARELGMIEPLPPEAIQALAEVLRTEPTNSSIGRYAVMALGKAGAPAIPALKDLTKSSNPQACQSAVWVLGLIAKREPAAWPILIDAFKTELAGSEAAFCDSSYQLAKLGPPAVPLLVKALKSDDPRVRAGGAETLAQMGRYAQTYRHSAPSVRKQAGIVAFATTPDLAPAGPDLKAALNDTDPKVRYEAAIALAYADPNSKRALPILVSLLSDEDLILHNDAAGALQYMGSNASDAAPAVERLLRSRDAGLRATAAQVLGKIGGAQACEPLAEVVRKEQNGGTCFLAARSLVEIRPACPQAIPALTDVLGKSCSAADLLAKVGKPAVPALRAALKSPDPDVREDAVKALAQMKPLPSEAVDALMLALRDKTLSVRSAAAAGLLNTEGEAGRAALAEQKREERIYAERSEPGTRLYSKDEIVASIPPDLYHTFPLTLAYLFPVVPVGGSVQLAKFLIALYTGRDRPELLVFWKKVGDDQYRNVRAMSSDLPGIGGDHFEMPIIFTARVEAEAGVPWQRFVGVPLQQSVHLPVHQFVDIPADGSGTQTDHVFAIGVDTLYPVKIESPVKWYKSKLGPGESVRSRAINLLSDDGLKFAFRIWNAHDPMCCPTAGLVIGTYKILEDVGTIGRGGRTIYIPGGGAGMIAMYAPGHRPVISTNRPIRPTWRMVVATARRERIPSATLSKTPTAPKRR